MKNLTATISFAVCIIFAISCKKESNFLLNDKQPERFQFHYRSNSGFETYRLRLSESYSVIITAFVDSNGVVTLTDSIVSAVSSDKYSLLDLSEIQTEAPGNPSFDSLLLRIISIGDLSSGLVTDDFTHSLATGTPAHKFFCECKSAEESADHCKVKKSIDGKVYCDASSILCEYCSLIVEWDDEAIIHDNNDYSAIIFKF